MPPQPIIVQLEAPCLMAGRQRVRLVTVKPGGRLAVSDTLGPHYGEGDRDEAIARANAFLELVSQQDGELAVAPEYFTPRETLENLIRNPEALRLESVFILPLESLDRVAHREILDLGRANNWDVRDAEAADNQGGTSLNTCAIVYRSRDRSKLFLQHKIYPSALEENVLIVGQEFFVFEGANIGLIVLICSDGNYRDYHQTWALAAARKASIFMAHVQWNPSSDNSAYSSLWASILEPEQGERRLFISCNWANDSVIEGIPGRNTTPRFRTRMFRRRKHLKLTPFRQQSQHGMHVEHRSVDRQDKWEIWHSLANSEHALALDIVRPYENVPDAQLSRGPTVTAARYFERNGQDDLFHEGIPQGLANPFWDLMGRLGVDRDQRRELETFSLHDVELIYNAGLIRQQNSWVSKDVARRLPTAPVLCPVGDCNDCAENPTDCGEGRHVWEEAAEDFAECLRLFWASELSRTQQLRMGVCSEYPLNLESHDGTAAGWLFHAKGKHSTRLAKELARLLMNKLRDSRRSIFLCGVGVGGRLPTDSEIYEAYRKVDEPEAASGDILNPDGCATLKIMNLRP